MRCRKICLLPLTFALATLFAAPVQAACPARVSAGLSDTIGSIAAACGVNAEALKQLNPGLGSDTLRPGMVVRVPRPPIPSTDVRIGRSNLQVQPLPSAPATIGSPTSTVILPASPPLLPHQVLRGFGDQPGQLPLPPGHSNPFPSFP